MKMLAAGELAPPDWRPPGTIKGSPLASLLRVDRKLLLLAYAQLRIACTQLLNKGRVELFRRRLAH
jgi:hypothetical protein